MSNNRLSDRYTGHREQAAPGDAGQEAMAVRRATAFPHARRNHRQISHLTALDARPTRPCPAEPWRSPPPHPASRDRALQERPQHCSTRGWNSRVDFLSRHQIRSVDEGQDKESERAPGPIASPRPRQPSSRTLESWPQRGGAELITTRSTRTAADRQSARYG